MTDTAIEQLVQFDLLIGGETVLRRIRFHLRQR